MILSAPKWRGTSLRGLRGLGDSKVVIGPDGQPRVVMDSPLTTVTVTPSGQDVYQDSTGAVISVSSGAGSSEWISGVPNIAVGLGGAAVLMMMFGAMRR